MSLPTVVIPLKLASKTIEIEQLADLDKVVEKAIHEKTNPYWAYLWPSARALAEHVSTLEVTGLRAIEIGCGLGAVSVAAALGGATVIASDISTDAMELAARNANRNGVSIACRGFDWNDPPEDLGKFDLIVAADVVYEDGMLSGVVRFIRAHLTEEGYALVADPMRVAASGMSGAARLNGMRCETKTLASGEMMTGGVLLHTLRIGRPA